MVILPLVVLKQEIFRHYTKLGLSFTVWDYHEDYIRYNSYLLIFVSAETAVLLPFRTFIISLNTREALDRVIVDKSYLILTVSNYRSKLRLIKYLRTL